MDYSKSYCPGCNTLGTLRRDTISWTIKCRSCGRSWASSAIKESEPEPIPKAPPRKKSATSLKANKYPSLPPTAKPEEVVEEFIRVVDDEGTSRLHRVGRIYCPRVPFENPAQDVMFSTVEGSRSDFENYLNVNNHAQFIMHVYQKKFQNRRRYKRDVSKQQSRTS